MVFFQPKSGLSQHASNFCVLLFLHYTYFRPVRERKQIFEKIKRREKLKSSIILVNMLGGKFKYGQYAPLPALYLFLKLLVFFFVRLSFHIRDSLFCFNIERETKVPQVLFQLLQSSIHEIRYLEKKKRNLIYK